MIELIIYLAKNKLSSPDFN